MPRYPPKFRRTWLHLRQIVATKVSQTPGHSSSSPVLSKILSKETFRVSYYLFRHIEDCSFISVHAWSSCPPHMGRASDYWRLFLSYGWVNRFLLLESNYFCRDSSLALLSHNLKQQKRSESITTYFSTLRIVPLFLGIHGVLGRPIWAEPVILEDCSFLVVG